MLPALFAPVPGCQRRTSPSIPPLASITPSGDHATTSTQLCVGTQTVRESAASVAAHGMQHARDLIPLALSVRTASARCGKMRARAAAKQASALFVALADGGGQLEIEVIEPHCRVPATARLAFRAHQSSDNGISARSFWRLKKITAEGGKMTKTHQVLTIWAKGCAQDGLRVACGGRRRIYSPRALRLS